MAATLPPIASYRTITGARCTKSIRTSRMPPRSFHSAVSRAAQRRGAEQHSKLCCDNYVSRERGSAPTAFNRPRGGELFVQALVVPNRKTEQESHASNVRSDLDLRLLIGRRLRYELRRREGWTRHLPGDRRSGPSPRRGRWRSRQGS